ncbi:MAG: nickel-responsive transcriptional regulator NikR [Thermoplasmata archaeon]|nr:nickel-responsive transcriptional regulator NikR [Thermoplasmata archaeon]
MTEGVVRLGISLEPELLGSLDRWVKERNSPSRSEAVRFLVRKELAEKGLEDPEADAVGTVTLLYRHDAPMVLRRLAAAQHRWGTHIQSSTHLHLRGEACVEVLLLVGKRREIEEAAEDIRGVKGILQGRFTTMTPGIAGAATGHQHPHRP